MADNSAKPILIAGAVGTVVLLGVAWNFAANVSEQAVIDAGRYAEENSDPVQFSLPGDETETAEADAEASGDGEASAEEAASGESETAEADAQDGQADGSGETETAEGEGGSESDTAQASEDAGSEGGSDQAASGDGDGNSADEGSETASAEGESSEDSAASGGGMQLASLEGDAAAGKKVFRKCQACHQIGDGAENGVGPALNDMVGGVMASADFSYSSGFQEANEEGRRWTVENLHAWLEKPKDFMPGTKMAFGGLRKEEDRQDVIAYMADAGGIVEGEGGGSEEAGSGGEGSETETAAADGEAEQSAAASEESGESEAAESEAASDGGEGSGAESESASDGGDEASQQSEASSGDGEGSAEAASAAGGSQTASIDGDAAAGEKVFRKCQACHQVGDGAKNAVGPHLNGIVGQTIGAVEGYSYSGGFEEANEAGKKWTVENLHAWLEKPKDFIAGTKMAFGGLRKEEDRQNVIAYLAEQEE